MEVGELLEGRYGWNSRVLRGKGDAEKERGTVLPCFGRKRMLQSCKASGQLGPVASAMGRWPRRLAGAS